MLGGVCLLYYLNRRGRWRFAAAALLFLTLFGAASDPDIFSIGGVMVVAIAGIYHLHAALVLVSMTILLDSAIVHGGFSLWHTLAYAITTAVFSLLGSQSRRYYNQLTKSNAQLKCVGQLALTLGRITSLDEIYHAVNEHTRALMDATAFIVSFYDREKQLVHAGFAITRGVVRDVSQFPPIPLEEPGQGTQSRVIRTGKPLYIPDWRKAMERTSTEYKVAEDGAVTTGPPPEEAQKDSVNSAIFVPMQIEGETIGVMQVQSYRLDGYTQEDIDLLAALANVAAVALHRVRAEEAVQRERDFAESLIETAQAIVLVLDTAGRILRFNPYMEEVSGYRLEEVQGQDWLATFLPERNETAMRELFRQVVSGIQMRGNVYPIVTRDGREREIEWYDKTLEDAGGNVVGLLAIGQDITERVKAEEALRESRDTVRELFQRLETAIEEERSRVARELHDDTLQQLMTVIWVLDPKEVGLEKVQAISQAVNEVADSIRRVVRGLRSSELDKPLAEAIRSLPLPPSDNVRLAVVSSLEPQIEAGLPDMLKVQVYRLVREAVTNAVRHSGASTITVLLHIEAESDLLQVMIDDDGRGFDLEAAREADHFGLRGMSERAAMLDAELRVESSPGQGARISTNVPLL